MPVPGLTKRWLMHQHQLTYMSCFIHAEYKLRYTSLHGGVATPTHLAKSSFTHDRRADWLDCRNSQARNAAQVFRLHGFQTFHIKTSMGSAPQHTRNGGHASVHLSEELGDDCTMYVRKQIPKQKQASKHELLTDQDD